MVNLFKTVWGMGKKHFPPSNTLIIVLALFFAALFLCPNGMESRVQRFGNMHMAALFCAGLYAMRYNKWTGILIAYSAVFMAVTTAEMQIITVMLIMSILFIFLAGTKFDKERIYNMICIITLLNVAWQIMQYFGVYFINIPFKEYAKMYVGLMSNVNEVSALIAISLPCFFRKRWFFLLPIVVIGLYLSKSYGGILAAVIISIIFALIEFRGKKRIGIILAGILSVAAFLAFIRPIDIKDHETIKTFKSRFAAYSVAWDTWGYNVITGWGIGQFKNVFPLVSAFNQLKKEDAILLLERVYDKNAIKALVLDKRYDDIDYFKKDRVPEIFLELHNEPLEWLFNTGIIGLILLSGSLFPVLIRGLIIRTPAFYGLFASCLCSLWFFGWHIIPIGLVTVTYAGMIENEWRSKHEKG